MYNTAPNQFCITSCTQKNKNDFRLNSQLGKTLPLLHLNYHNDTYLYTKIFYENTRGMSECYNEAIEDAIKSNKAYIIFTHDDVALNDILMFNKLIESFKTADIIGVAGSSDFSIRRHPVCWHNSPRESWSGGCYHPNADKSDSINEIYYTPFGAFGKTCAIIDGVFIAARVDRLKETGVRFDPQFKFDFYDTDFSISCYNAGLKIKTAPILLTHFSHGAGLNKASYAETQEKFLKKYISK